MTDKFNAKALLTTGEHRDLGAGWSADLHAVVVEDTIAITVRCREHGSTEDLVLSNAQAGIQFPKNLPATCREPLFRLVSQAVEAVIQHLDQYCWR